MKKINISLLIIICAILSILNVQAKDNTLEIILPTNTFNNKSCINTFSKRELIVIDAFATGDRIINEKGKDIISINRSADGKTEYYELLSGVTEEDCTIEITQELIDNIQDVRKRVVNAAASGAANINYQEEFKESFIQATEGYDKIKFVLKNKECKVRTEKMIIDFSNSENFLDLSYAQITVLEQLMTILSENPNEYPITLKIVDENTAQIVKRSNNKVLYTVTMEHVEPVFKLGTNLTEQDSFTIQLKEGNYLGDAKPFIKEIEFRFGSKPTPPPEDEVVEIPNTSKMLPAYLYLGSAISIILGTIIIVLVTDKKREKII